MAVDAARLDEFVNRALGDLGSALTVALVDIGDRLGLYRAMAGEGTLTPAELARRTGTAERYVREWLSQQAAAGIVVFHADSATFSLPDEQATVLADESSPAFLAGGFQVVCAALRDAKRIAEAFRNGDGVAWGDHDADLFGGTERFFRAGYNANLVDAWLPALDGVVEKLERGARVADVGCGLGSSTVIMAQAFPRSSFVGFDFHGPSVEAARRAAQDAGVAERAHFERATAKTYPGADYDLVTCFDCLHDMGDPVGASAHIFESLRLDGTWMLVEPFASDRLEENLNPIGRLYYAASTLVCTPASLAQEVGLALGAQAGEARLREVVAQGGFSRFRRATETPFNLVFEARR